MIGDLSWGNIGDNDEEDLKGPYDYNFARFYFM